MNSNKKLKNENHLERPEGKPAGRATLVLNSFYFFSQTGSKVSEMCRKIIFNDDFFSIYVSVWIPITTKTQEWKL